MAIGTVKPEVLEQRVRILGKYFVVLMFGLFVLFGSTFVVGSGERGLIVSKFTGTQQESYDEGIHLKIPIVHKAIKMEVRTQKYETEASSASKDLQIVSTTVALNYHIEPSEVHNIYQNIGKDYTGRVIDPSVQEVVKEVTARFNAEELITKRPEVKEAIKVGLRERLTSYHLVLDDMSIKNFDFSPEFNRAIEAKVTAEQRALEEQNKLKIVEFQAQQKVVEARGRAESIEIINKQLLRSPQYVEFYIVDKWDGVMPLALGSGSLLSIASDASVDGVSNSTTP